MADPLLDMILQNAMRSGETQPQMGLDLPGLGGMPGALTQVPPMPLPQASPELMYQRAMAPPPKPTRKEAIAQSIGDFLQSVGAGLAHRGRAGQSTGAGAAMMTPFLLAQERAKQERDAQQTAMQNALKAVALRTTQQNVESQDMLRRQQAAVQEQQAQLLEPVQASFDEKTGTFVEDPNGRLVVPRGKLGQYSVQARGQNVTAATAGANRAAAEAALNQRLGATATENLLNRQAAMARTEAGLGGRTVQTGEGVKQFDVNTGSYTKRVGSLPPRFGVGFTPLTAAQDATVEDVARRVVEGELKTTEALSLLGGVRGGLGIRLIEKIGETGQRVVPKDVRDQITAVQNAKAIMAPIQDFLDQIKRGENVVANTAQLRAYGLANGTRIARALGEKGVVTDKDREAAIGLIPGWKSANFAPDFAQTMLNTMMGMFDRQEQILTQGYFKSVQGPKAGPAAAQTKTINGVIYEKAEGGWRRKK